MIHKIELPADSPGFINNLCLSYRHDFGLMSEEQKDMLRFECREWIRSILNNAQRITRCSDCINNRIDKDYETGYITPYCSKDHWVGDDNEPYPNDWVDPWRNCNDYQPLKG